MQFHDVGSDARGGFDLFRRRIDEQRHANAALAQPRNIRRQMVMLARHVEAALRRQLLAALRYEAAGMRQEFERESKHLGGGGHLQIERVTQRGFEARDVVIPDMTPVLAQMRGNAVRSRLDGEFGRAQRIGMAAAARIPDGRHMVDIHAEA